MIKRDRITDLLVLALCALSGATSGVGLWWIFDQNTETLGASIAYAIAATVMGGTSLFGGEGGVVGTVDIEFGGVAQGVNSYLAAKMGGLMPAFRGLLGLVLRSPQVSSMNPYIKPWAIYASRINGGFYPAKAAIGESMNPAHIIYEVLTSYEFGIGMAPSDIDLASFTAAADTLYAEGMGLWFFWEGEQSAEDWWTATSAAVRHSRRRNLYIPSTPVSRQSASWSCGPMNRM